MKDTFDLSPLKQKKRKNSKKKGNAFENKVCKILNERFGKDKFHRTPGSGAFATTHRLPDHLVLEGDIITPPDFKFCIECKKGYNKEGLASFFKTNSTTVGFLKKLEEQCRKVDKKPLLIMAQDRQPTLAFIPLKCISRFIVSHLNWVTVSNFSLQEVYLVLVLEDLLSLGDSCFF